MTTTFTFRDLEVWRAAMDLAADIYGVSGGFPKSELYGLTSQMRRAAVSIPSNLAEGHSRRTTNSYANHVSIALGSQGALVTCIELCSRLHLLNDEQPLEALASGASRVGQMLYRLHQSLQHRTERSS